MYGREEKCIQDFGENPLKEGDYILRGPGGERIVDIPGGTELELQVKTGSWAGRTHSQ
jgi:hypothetical protein